MAAAPLSDLPGWARAMLETEPVGRLGMLDDEGRPRVLPVTFALHEEALVTAIDAKPKRSREPARVRFFRRSPHAALTVDRYGEDWDQLAWVQVLGAVSVREAGEDAGALDALSAKYRQYREQPPPGPVLRLEPVRALCWRAAEG